MPPIEQSEPYIPRTDLGFKVWLQNMAEQLDLDASRFGATEADAALVMSTYLGYSNALDAAVMPGSRNATTVAAKDAQKASALATIRPLAMILKSNQGVSNEDKALLGLHIDDGTRTPVAQPATAPMLSIQAMFSGEHQLRFADELTPDLKKKPAGVIQLELYVYVGPTPTTNYEDADFVGVYTKNPIQYTFSPTQAGLTATYFARWRTRTGLVGPWSLPVGLMIAFGGPVEQQLSIPTGGTPLTAGGEDELKIAA